MPPFFYLSEFRTPPSSSHNYTLSNEDTFFPYFQINRTAEIVSTMGILFKGTFFNDLQFVQFSLFLLHKNTMYTQNNLRFI